METAIGNAFCSGGTEKKDCDAVLTSKGAELLKGYKLSDFSLLYFIILSFLTFVQIQNPNISFIISVIALPITIYSIYYQYFILKKWCLLCLTIVGVLWIQSFFIFWTGGFSLFYRVVKLQPLAKKWINFQISQSYFQNSVIVVIRCTK